MKDMNGITMLVILSLSKDQFSLPCSRVPKLYLGTRLSAKLRFIAGNKVAGTADVPKYNLGTRRSAYAFSLHR
jgi:hypothetical protein